MGRVATRGGTVLPSTLNFRARYLREVRFVERPSREFFCESSRLRGLRVVSSERAVGRGQAG
jgi:hypothetical protein